MTEGFGAASAPMRPVGLHWSVKRSLVEYVLSLSDGRVSAKDGAVHGPDGAFFFPLTGFDAHTVEPLAGRIQFSGTVELDGHYGMMALALSKPVIDFGAESAVLSAEIRGQLRPLAKLPHVAGTHQGPNLIWAGWTAALTSEGAREFRGYYAAGELLDPLNVRIPDPAHTEPRG